MSKQRRSRRQEILTKLRSFLMVEGGVLLTGLSAFAGAASFFALVQRAWEIKIDNWWIWALVSTMFALPKIFARIRKSKAPMLIKAATAFREGFLALQEMAPDISQWVTKMRSFWKNINRPL